MKILVGITNNLFSENSPYEMCTLDTDVKVNIKM